VGLQLMCVGLAAVIAAMIVAAGWYTGSHCPRCGAACYARRELQRKMARQAAMKGAL
jgi:hypothetical protein